jgi:hypothetical protein
LVDCELLKEIYINLLDQKEPKLNFLSNEESSFKNDSLNKDKKSINAKVIMPTDEEIQLHKKYLKTYLPKNNYS